MRVYRDFNWAFERVREERFSGVAVLRESCRLSEQEGWEEKRASGVAKVTEEKENNKRRWVEE